VKAGWPVDVGVVATSGATTFNSRFHGQRGALAIRAGAVYVPYGGLFGDCQPGPSFPSVDPTPYHGWIVSVSISDPSAAQAWATPACAGGLWAPGGISSDRTSLYVATGNTDPACTMAGTVWGGGERGSPFRGGRWSWTPPDYLAPTNWATFDLEDLEMGSAPVLFDLPGSTPGQLAIVFGKDGAAYLLDRAHLGGVGNALGADASAPTHAATLHVAANVIITAPAVYATAAAT
jgi:hypothetical protein